MCAMPPQIKSLTFIYSTVYSGADQRKHQSSASLAFVGEFTDDRHKGPETRKMFPFVGVTILPSLGMNLNTLQCSIVKKMIKSVNVLIYLQQRSAREGYIIMSCNVSPGRVVEGDFQACQITRIYMRSMSTLQKLIIWCTQRPYLMPLHDGSNIKIAIYVTNMG